MSVLCRIEDLHLAYQQGMNTTRFCEISAEIPAGVCIALYGRSGSGKSTCLMQSPRPEATMTKGASRACLDQLSDDALCALRAQRIGIVYQSFNLLPTLTVAEHLGLRLELIGRPSRPDSSNIRASRPCRSSPSPSRSTLRWRAATRRGSNCPHSPTGSNLS